MIDLFVIPSYYWTTVPCSLELDTGDYTIELYTRDPNQLSLIGGTVYGEANDVLIDGYPLQGTSADLKLLINQTYPIHFYGGNRIELLNGMSWQPYASASYD